MSGTHFFNDFFKNWASERFKQDGISVYFPEKTNPELYHDQKMLWQNVYKNLESLFTHPEYQGINLEKFSPTRIAQIPNGNQMSSRKLREEPFLYAYADESDFFVIKFVLSPVNGIQIGIDYIGRKFPGKQHLARFHRYLGLSNREHGFLLKGSKKNETRGYDNEQDALAAINDGETNKVEPCFLIPVNDTWDDDQYLNMLQEKLQVCMAFRQEILSADRNHSPADGSSRSSSLTEEYYLNYADLKKIWEKHPDIDAGLLNGIFKFKKATFQGEPLTYLQKGKKEAQLCVSMGTLRVGLVTHLLRKGLIDRAVIEELKHDGVNAREYQIPGEQNPIRLRTYTSAGDIFASLHKLWTDSKLHCSANPSELSIFFQPGSSKEKWENLKDKSPELYELLRTALQEKKEEPRDDFRSQKGKTVPPLPKLSRNRIFAGAPGTGKSRKLADEADTHFGNNIVRVTFHPEYSYYDFVGSYRPKMSEKEKDKIVYGFVPGPFAKILKDALVHPTTPYCLIIEEINRARVAAVFGDIFQLLDRYSKDDTAKGQVAHVSEYPIDPSEELARYLGNAANAELRLPANLYIWATMNSADQGVFPMDTAFKRRWSFEYQPLNESDENSMKYENAEGVKVKDKWDNIRRGINGVLLEHHVNEDKLMGYYFLKEEEREADDALTGALCGKVLMYLFDDAAKPFRKDIFKGTLLYSELRNHLQLDATDLGIFKADVNPEMREIAGKEPNSGDNTGTITPADATDSVQEQ